MHKLRSTVCSTLLGAGLLLSGSAWAGITAEQANAMLGAAATGDTGALQQLQASGAQGDALAQYDLGALYVDGRGVPQDLLQAVSWYRKSAEQGNALAQYNLGRLYDQGLGVSQSDGLAVTWYRKAAEQGLPDAQNDLGSMYAAGRGVPQDDSQAIKWLTLAKENGDALAGVNLQQCLSTTTQAQATKGRKLADAWWTAHHRGE